MNPYYDNAASGMIVGWRQKHGRDELFRAVEEGICFEFKLAMEGIQAASGERINEYVILGGGSNSDLWCQTAADILGATVTEPTPSRRPTWARGSSAPTVSAGTHRSRRPPRP